MPMEAALLIQRTNVPSVHYMQTVPSLGLWLCLNVERMSGPTGGFSNPVTVHLNSGTNQLEIQFDPKINENMNGQVNSALIDYIRLRRKN